MENWREGVLEGGSDGVGEFWRIGVLEGGSFGELEFWRDGVLEGRSFGGTEFWRIGVLEGRSFGGREFWRTKLSHFYHQLNHDSTAVLITNLHEFTRIVSGSILIYLVPFV